MFARSADGGDWSEILVDRKKPVQRAISLDPAAASGIAGQAALSHTDLELKLSPRGIETPAMRLLLLPKLRALKERSEAGGAKLNMSDLKEVEVSAAVMEHALDLGERLMSNAAGGAALCIDYGYEDTPGRFTCRAIHNHKLLGDLLELPPGEADITADVDFGAIRWAIESAKWKDDRPPSVHGPVSQAKFLQSLGIQYRVQNLLKSKAITSKQAEDLVLGYRRLVASSSEHAEGMGEIYKAMAITSLPKELPPVGFG